MIADLVPRNHAVANYHFTQDVNYDHCDALILSGSPLFASKYQKMIESDELTGSDYCEVHEAVGRLLDFPNLIYGICFGSQILAHMLGGVVSHTGQTEIGYLEHELTKAGKGDPIFGDLPTTFFAAHSHDDIVEQLPSGKSISESAILATRNDQIHAWKVTLHDGRTHYGTQFHPEMSTPQNAQYFVLASRDELVATHGEAGYQQLLEVPDHAGFEISNTLTSFLEQL